MHVWLCFGKNVNVWKAPVHLLCWPYHDEDSSSKVAEEQVLVGKRFKTVIAKEKGQGINST